MKKLIALVTLTAMQLTPAMAIVGGPWSGNTPDSHITGLFAGMMTMPNGSGIFRFTATETAQLGVFSSSLIYYKGVTYLGSCQANVDFQNKKVFGITNGSAYNRSPRPTQQQTPPLNDNNASFQPTTPNLSSTTFNIPLTPTVSGTTVTARTFSVPAAGASGPVGIGNTSWEGKITQSAPYVRFKARGEAAFFGNQPITFRLNVIEDPPEAFEVPASGTTPATIIIVGGRIREVSVDNGGNDPFPEPRNRVKLRVFGSRIAYNVAPSAGGTNGGLDGTGGGGFAF